MQNPIRVVMPEVNRDPFQNPQDSRLISLAAAVRAAPIAARRQAGRFQTWIEEYLRNSGQDVMREIDVGRGRIDLVVSGNPEMGIELDYRSVRYKSIEKLELFRYRVAVLRWARPDEASPIPGVIVIYCYGVGNADELRKSPNRPR